jgi:hypothetical protein
MGQSLLKSNNFCQRLNEKDFPRPLPLNLVSTGHVPNRLVGTEAHDLERFFLKFRRNPESDHKIMAAQLPA